MRLTERLRSFDRKTAILEELASRGDGAFIVYASEAMTVARLAIFIETATGSQIDEIIRLLDTGITCKDEFSEWSREFDDRRERLRQSVEDAERLRVERLLGRG